MIVAAYVVPLWQSVLAMAGVFLVPLAIFGFAHGVITIFVPSCVHALQSLAMVASDVRTRRSS